ncbi:hypothetical protein, conserved [Babesia bigemina]|uniref:C3H1-type domain-containing protein n=1 Tax=Babesia bigemina TaxID=5866 RepID=A0A061BM13_BABBI|nr:hypothetical protein, conserved [Babesia bigemina]CDR71916.1 hypothetical protein, conserved [Babesia bigemina]|eukprot:XP_012770858.1 hypothetical protein, conserved [Babesia bigemina]
MGFLSGILSNIQGHLGQHKNTLDIAINSLKQNKHLGKNGFNIAIGEVVKGVRGYNERVKESNDKVSKPIKKLQADLNKKFDEKASAILPKQHENAPTEIGHAVSRAVSLVDECKSFARVFFSNMRKAEEDFKAISYLNDECKNNVNNARDNIFHEAEMLNRWSSKGKEWKDFKTVESLIQSTLTSLGNCVNTDITEKITAFVNELMNKISAILKELQRIDKQLWESVLSLEDWIKRTKSDITFLQKDVAKILEEVKWGDRGEKSANRQNLEAAAMTLRGKAEELYQAGKAAKEKVQETARKALAQVKSMDEAIKGDLYKVKDAVNKQVAGIKDAIGKLYGVVTTGNSESGRRNESIADVIKHVKIQAISIKGTNNGRAGGLAAAEKKTEDYVGMYGTPESFENTVKGWMDDVLGREAKSLNEKGLLEEQIKGYVNTYITDKNNIDKLQASKGNVNAIVKAIKEKVMYTLKQSNFIKQASETVNNASKSNMKERIEAVIKGINNFVTALGTKLAKDAMTSFVDEILTLVEHDIVNSGEEGKTYKDILRGTVSIVVIALASKASQASKEIETFALGQYPNLAATVQGAYNTASDLHTKLETAISKSGTNYAAAVDAAIDGVTRTLEEKLPKGTGSTATLETETTFNQYNEFVIQESGPIKNGTDLTGTDSEGHLPAAIGAIKTEVEKALEQVQKINEEAEKQLQEVNEETHRLCNSVRRAGRDVNRGLNDLIDGKIEEQLSKIKEQIKALHNTIETVVAVDTKKLLTYAENAGNQILTQLTKHVNDVIKQATDKLTTTLRKNYVTSARDALTTFSAKIHHELEKLPAAIDRDLTMGFKGFMKAVEGEVTEGKTTGQNIKKLSSLAADPVDSAEKTAFENLSKAFKHFWSPLASYVNKEIVRLNEEENDKKHPVVKDVYDYHGQLIAIYDAFNEALTHIHRTHRYDHTLPELLDNVDAALSNLKPDGFAKPSSPAIDGLIAGLTHFIGELRRVYISSYDSVTFGGELVKNSQSEKTELTKEGRNVAKAFLTILATLFHDLDRLRGECRSLSKQKINQSTDLGRTMRDLGYSVSVDKQDGELQNKETVLGENVYKRILWPIKEADGNEHLEGCESRNHDRNDKFHLLDILNCICSHVEEYNQVSHCATFAAKRQPCSVFEMLIWFAGLPYNNAYAELKSDGFTDLLDNPAKPLTDDDDIIVYDMDSFFIDACPRKFTYKNIRTVLHHICTKSYDILCAIGGHGDAGTIYGIDFCNNSFGLKYPQSGADCLQMFLDVLRRILPPLRYLFKRCGVKADQFGWSDCLYGRDIATGKSQCTEHSSDQPKCQPTSPLMSYLNDCLPGHLPHQVSAIGCKAECKTCPTSKPGMPCLTPLGFRGFSGSTRKGWDLYETLSYFFGTNLISSLLCVVTKPPSTLPEHFGFALSLVKKWHESGTHLIKDAFHSSTLSRSIGLYDQTATLTDALRNAYGSTQNGHPNREVKRADLSSLSTSTASAEQTAYTAPYLHSLCYDAYYYVAKKHVNAYLSWALYLPWDFHKYLENLHDALKNIFCRDWGCSTCLRADKCKRGEHGLIEGACKCSSVVSCKGILPTLYKYGFVFEDAKSLTASEKTCFAFIQQVQNVIRSTYFTELFDRCDDFLFSIRQPFIWLNVALWSLSLFYLICVMVGRLDVLHIRSHLRSPSSHKITAQSLLAAAQVGRLAKISYLQP